jgi:hypothetical protein
VLDLRQFDFSSIADITAVANTPAYLYKQLRHNPIVEKLASIYSAVELLQHASDLLEGSDLTQSKLAETYGVIVAATYSPFQEFATARAQFAFPLARWARDLVACRFHACRPGVPSQAGPAFHGMTGRGEAGR